MDNSQKHIVILAVDKHGQWAGEKWHTGSFLNPSQWGRMVGETFRSDYKDKMEALRETDNKIRDWAQDLDKLVKKMRKANKANRMMDVAILLAELNNRFKGIEDASNELEELGETGLKDLEQSMEENETDYEENLDIELLRNLEVKAQLKDLDVELLSGLEVRAQFQWLKDWKKKWDASSLEKKYRRERRMAINKLIDGANRAVQNVSKMLVELKSHRKRGDVDKYIKALSRVSKEQNNFKNSFVPVYNTYLKPVVDKALQRQKEDVALPPGFTPSESIPAPPPASEFPVGEEARMDAEFREELGDVGGLPPPVVEDITESIKEPVEQGGIVDIETPAEPISDEEIEEEEEIRTGDIGAIVEKMERAKREKQYSFQEPGSEGWQPPSGRDISIQEEWDPSTEQQRPPWHGMGLGQPKGKAKEWELPEPKEVPMFFEEDETEPLEKILLKKQHSEFMSELGKIAARHSDPFLIASVLIKYAGLIENKDLETSLKLLAIVEGVDAD